MNGRALTRSVICTDTYEGPAPAGPSFYVERGLWVVR